MQPGHLLCGIFGFRLPVPSQLLLPGVWDDCAYAVSSWIPVPTNWTVGRCRYLQCWFLLPWSELFDSMSPGLVLPIQLVRCRRVPRALRVPDGPARLATGLSVWLCLRSDWHVGSRAVSARYILCGGEQHGDAVLDWIVLRHYWLIGARRVHGRRLLRGGAAERAQRQLQRGLLLPVRVELADAGAMFESHLLPGRQRFAGRVSNLIVLPERGDGRGHCVHSRHVLRHVGAVGADWLVQWRVFLRGRVELGDRDSVSGRLLLPGGRLPGDRVPRLWRVRLAGPGGLYRVPGRIVFE